MAAGGGGNRAAFYLSDRATRLEKGQAAVDSLKTATYDCGLFGGKLMRIPEAAWVSDPRYGTLLYFCQIVEEMFWHGTRDSYRPPSLDPYHRSVELSKVHADLREASLPSSQILAPVFDEFISFVGRDLAVKKYYGDAWKIVSHYLRDKQGNVESKISAIKLFERVLEGTYLRKCRDEIESYAGNAKPKDKLAYRVLAGNYFSFLLNVGHSPEHIYFHTQRHFFERELVHNPTRELQDFFRFFPGRESDYKVFVSVSPEMQTILAGIDGVNTAATLPKPMMQRHAKLIHELGSPISEFSNIKAFDGPGAWSETARLLSLTRALAYTGKPAVELGWKPVMIISTADHLQGSAFSEPVTPLRRRYRVSSGDADKTIGERRAIISRTNLTDQDRNRLLNAITGYADAFHSESPATQLVSLWSSLEGLLPSPILDIPRIQSFLRDVCAAQQDLYLENKFSWLYVDLIKLYRDEFTRALEPVTEYQEGVAKLFAALCFEQHDKVRARLGILCAQAPLATQRMFELYDAAKTCGSLYGTVINHLEKVRWHLLRIYRERNRIVHRANPSKNVSSLIVNLNEYILVCLDAFFRAAAVEKKSFVVDDVFSEIFLRQESRTRNVGEVSAMPVSQDNAQVVAGFELR